VELKGKTAIITGSGRGIGRSLALEFARQGANVICCARRENEVKETVEILKKTGGKGVAVKTDVAKKEQVEEMIALAIKEFGRIDVLFNNAASFSAIGGLWEVEPEAWWQDITVNLLGSMLCCHAVLPYMMKNNDGIIINMNGGGAVYPLPGGSGYGSSKAALMRLTDGLATELKMAGSSVLVFGMGPGFVKTETTEIQLNTSQGKKWLPSSQEAIDQRLDRSPDDCAKATVKLIRVACPQLSGRIFDVDTDFSEITKRAEEIQEEDLFVMRLKK